MEVNEFKQKLREAGAVGAGGAGFPTYAKLGGGIDTVILNCAECEPLLRPHRHLLSKYPREALRGLDALRESVGAKRALVGIKRSYAAAVEALNAVSDEFGKISVSYLPEIYPAGDEVVLIYETTGRVVGAGKLPASEGVCVFNVETAYNTYRALEDKNVTHKYVTITGEVEKPCTLRLPIGMSFDDSVKLAGKIKCDGYVYISGGPMTGRIVSGSECVTKTTNAILVMPENHYIVNKRRAKVSSLANRAMSACCQCRTCTDMCPRNLLGHPIEPHSFMRAVRYGDNKQIKPVLNTAFCSGCGVCEMYACPQGLSPRTLITECKGELRREGIKPPEAEMKNVAQRREYARIPMARLTARLGLKKYDTEAPLDEKEICPKSVRILFSQHIGAPAVCCVKEGEHVSEGQCIAHAADGALSVNIHSSVDGIVKAVTQKYAVIESDAERGLADR